MTDEDASIEELLAEARDSESGHGPGVVLGILAGAIAGAVAATVLSSPNEEGPQAAVGVAQPETPVERALALLATLRGRVQEAQAEGRMAAREAEDEMRQRFSELTRPSA